MLLCLNIFKYCDLAESWSSETNLIDIARLRLGKHVSAASDTCATIKEMYAVFPKGSVHVVSYACLMRRYLTITSRRNILRTCCSYL
jgi:hypothetical protein